MQKNKKLKYPKLVLKDGTEYSGASFGANKSVSGEVVFATGMVGYVEALTDPSFKGQILVLTFPLVGNYGVPKKELWESDKIQVSGLIVCNYIDTPSHHASTQTLSEWLKSEGVPALEIKDTRALTEKLRDEGVALGKIKINSKDIPFENPDLRNLPAEVSTKEIYTALGKKEIGKKIVVIDCGAKRNIVRNLVKRGLEVVVVPHDTDVMALPFTFDAVLISNGPGDPTRAIATINNVKKIGKHGIPMLGICLGNQIMALAFGGNTYKLKFGHRSQNQPVVENGKKRGYLTTQNHGFAVNRIPKNFREWFHNANDKTNEGIIHEKLPFMSVQFHPESSPGPLDTDWIFDYFLERAKIYAKKK